MAAQIEQPLETYRDSDGAPLENGYIYIGTSGLNAEASPISVYWDAAYTIPASQPIRTVGGFASRNGTKANIFVSSSYSIVIKDKNGVLVFSGDSLTDPAVAVGVADAQLRAWEAEAEAMTSESYAIEPEDTFVNVYTSDGDGTFTATPSANYSSLHWAAKSALGAASVNLPTITAGTAGKHIRVNSGETGYEFTDVTSGSYTPVVSNTTNVSLTSLLLGNYIRVGNFVHCSVTMSITQTATATPTTLHISLPIASNFTLDNDLVGTGGLKTNAGINQVASMRAATSLDLGEITMYSDTTSASSLKVTFTYEIK